MTGPAEIENGMVARVAAASDANVLGYRIRTVDSYGGQLDSEDMPKLVKQFPAVFFVYGGEPRPESLGQTLYQHAPTFAAICATRLRGNEGRSRHGTDAEPGSYQLVRDVTALLVGQNLGLEISPIEPGRVSVLFDGIAKRESLSIISVEFHSAYNAAAAALADLGDFSTFHAAWDIPVHGNVADASGEGDATDTITGLEA